MSPHILLTTFGSLGDLHPYAAVGLALRERGATVTIGTSEVFRERVESNGLTFRPLRPDFGHMLTDPDIVSKAVHPRGGGDYILRRIMLPALEASYEDTLPLAREADLLVNHAISFATPIVADLLKKPWISVALQPSGILSAYDQPAISAAPWMDRLRFLGPPFWGAVLKLGRFMAGRLAEPINQLRTKLGGSRAGNPIFDGISGSPHGKHGWFSRIMTKPQPDWPPGIEITGFPFFEERSMGLTPELERFLAAGPPPVVFTLGSAAVFDAGTFYRESAAAAESLGCRAVLLIGPDPRNRPERLLPDNIITAEYAPYSEIFSRAAAIVHQGGIGTTAQALRSGHPMIVVPYSHDQPDNARRVVTLGAAKTVARTAYNARTAAKALSELLANKSYENAAKHAAAAIAEETGAVTAAELLLKML